MWKFTATHDHRFSIKDETGLSIAITHNQDEESRKAARLIAAAPELLEALKVFLIEHETCLKHGKLSAMTFATGKARAAIQRAEG